MVKKHSSCYMFRKVIGASNNFKTQSDVQDFIGPKGVSKMSKIRFPIYFNVSQIKSNFISHVLTIPSFLIFLQQISFGLIFKTVVKDLTKGPLGGSG